MKRLTLFFYLLATVVTLSSHSPNRDTTKKTSEYAQKQTFYNLSIKVDVNNVPLDSTQFYFPLMGREDSIPPKKSAGEISIAYKFTDPSHIGDFRNKWYSGCLFRMGEPLLFNKPLDSEVVRMTWLRSFHNPVVITIEKKKDGYSLHWKRSDGMGGYDPGKVVEDKEKKLDSADWKTLEKKLQEANFWGKEYLTAYIEGDGSECVIETAGADSYWVKRNWGITSVGRYILALTDMKIPQGNVY